MNKKKAIKIATASAIAASAFVAPVASQAAVNYSKLVKDTNALQTKAYNTYVAAAKAGDLLDANEAKTLFNNAKAAYVKAANAVKKAPAKDRAALRKSLDTAYNKFAKPVYTYYVAVLALEEIKAPATKLQVAKTTEEKKALVATVSAKLEDSAINAKLNAAVPAKELFAQELDTVKALVKAVNEQLATLVEITKATGAVKDGVLTVDAEIKNFEAKEAVVKVYAAGDTTKPAAAEVKGTVKDGKVSFKVEKLPVGKHKFVVEAGDVKGTATEFEITAPSKVAVDAVAATNLKNITVKFNGEVEAKSVTSSTVKVFDGTTLLSNVTLSVGADNKTVYITSGTNFTQAKEYKVVVENVEKKGDATQKVEKTEKTVTTLDTVLPTIEGVTATSPKTIEITFSEPVQTGAGGYAALMLATGSSVLTEQVQIDGINTFASVGATGLNTTNKITLTLNTALTAGDHKVKIMNLKDFANLPIIGKEFTVNIPVDTAAPEVTAVEVINKDQVKVTFNEPIDTTSVVANDATKIAFGGVAPTAVSASSDNKSFTFTLGTALNLGAVVEGTFSYKGVKDNYGNTVADAKTFKFKANDDTTAPAVVRVVANSDNTVEVEFSEEVSVAAADFELYDAKNVKLNNALTVVGKTIDGSTSKKVFTLTYTGKDALSGAHSIKVLGTVKDLSIRTNALTAVTQPVTFNDKVAPKLVKAEFVNEVASTLDFNSDADYFDSKVTIYFDEAMDANTLANKANYLIDGTTLLADVAGSSLTVANDAKSVTITFTSTTTLKTITTATDIRLIALKDAAGNTLDTSQLNQSIGTTGLSKLSSFAASPAFSTAVSKAEAIAKNQVKLTAVDGYLFSAINPNGIKFAETATPNTTVNGLQVTNVQIAADAKTAVLTLNQNMSADVKFDGEDVDTTAAVVKLYADASAITLSNGAKTEAVALADAIEVSDVVAPKVSLPADGKLDATTNTVAVVFDEALAAGLNTAALAQAFTVKKATDGTLLVPGTDYTVSYTGATVAIKVIKPGFNDKVTVALTNNTVIKDAATTGNFAVDFAATESDNAVVSTGTAVTFGALSQTTAGVLSVAKTEATKLTSGTFTVADLSASSLNVSLNGGAPVSIALTGIDGTEADGAAVATELNTLIDAAIAGDKIDVTFATGKFTFTTKNSAATGVKPSLAFQALAGLNLDADASTDGVAGVATVAEVNAFSVTGGAKAAGSLQVTLNDGTVDQTVTVDLLATDDTVDEVATKVRAALTANATIGAAYTIGGTAAEITLTSKADRADRNVQITLIP